MKKIKILHIFGKMDRGGAEMRTLDLMEKLAHDQPHIQFDYCVLSGKPGELDSQIRLLGGDIHYLPLNSYFIPRFKKILKEKKYHTVHSHVHLFSGLILKLSFACKVPVRICHLHTTGENKSLGLRKKLQNSLMRYWLFKYSTDVIGVSQGALDIFLKKTPKFTRDPRCRLIYDAIDPARFEIEAQDRDLTTPVIIHIGRIEPVKNHPRLLEIFSTLVQKIPGSRLVLVGNAETSAQKKLEKLAKTLGISNQVTFLGSRNDVPELLSTASLMIFPSFWEGLPGVVLEASASGVPVLSSDLPGSRELGKYFPSVHCLDLSESNEVWCEAAMRCLKTSEKSRKNALTLLKASPFTLDFCLSHLIPIWTRSQ